MDMKYIDAEKLKAEIERRKKICEGIFERESDTYYQGKAVAYGELLSFINSLQQEHPEGIEGVVHHYANVHYINADKKQLTARLKDFEEGAEVRIFINVRKGEVEWSKKDEEQEPEYYQHFDPDC